MLIKTGQGLPSLAHGAIRSEFAKHGIDATRVELIAFVPTVAEHLRLHARVDIALDTFPYNGTTTTCEALWMGVPVVSLAGRTHVSRVGVSLSNAVGLGDLVADDRDRYVEIAVALARDSSRLTDLHSTLRPRMHSSPLMDGPSFARKMEQAYHRMWHAYARG
jgi:predicted O-linked N-acetylglucosamine transferase (SPINDLY family)